MALELAQNVFKSTVFGLVACALGAGCSKTVVLGSECPAQEGPCGTDKFLPQPESGSGNADTSTSRVDAGEFPASDSAPSDAGGFQAVDATQLPSDAGEPVLDAGGGQTTDSAPDEDVAPSDAGANNGVLQNPSFELTANPNFGVIESQFGLDVLVSDLAGYVPRAGEFFANIDPWFACWVGAQVESDLGGRFAGGLEATNGEALISTGYGPFILLPGLFQLLEQPLEAGRSYSFKFDAINSGTGRSALWVGATNIPCTMPTVHAATPEITNRNSWDEYCVTFRAPRALSTFALVPVDVADGGVGQVSFDNFQQVESCTQAPQTQSAPPPD
jgi:hypothetical protein